MSGIIDGIRVVQKPNHDTIYCNNTCKAKLLSTIEGSKNVRADNLQISGLEVVVNSHFVFPIVCERGDIFDLTEDYKHGEAEPVNI